MLATGHTPTDTRQPQYQELKGRIHQELLNRLNLDRLTQMSRAEAEPEIRAVILDLLDRENQRVRSASPSARRSSPTSSTSCSASARSRRCSRIRRSRTSWSTARRRSYVEREGKLEETDVVFRDDKHLLQIIERIVSAVGRRIDESSPMVDARLPDGSRVNAIIPPLALDGPACRSAASAPTGSAPTTWSTASR